MKVLFIVWFLFVSGILNISSASNYRFLGDGSVVSDFTDADMQMLLDNIQAALNDNRKVVWKNNETGNGGQVKPADHLKWKGLDCRFVEITNQSKLKQATTIFKFCKTKEGIWKAAP